MHAKAQVSTIQAERAHAQPLHDEKVTSRVALGDIDGTRSAGIMAASELYALMFSDYYTPLFHRQHFAGLVVSPLFFAAPPFRFIAPPGRRLAHFAREPFITMRSSDAPSGIDTCHYRETATGEPGEQVKYRRSTSTWHRQLCFHIVCRLR